MRALTRVKYVWAGGRATVNTEERLMDEYILALNS